MKAGMLAPPSVSKRWRNNHFFPRWEDWFRERFVRFFAEPPRELTLDSNVFDDPTPGQQQLTFYQGLLLLLLLLTRPLAATKTENPKSQDSNPKQIRNPKMKTSAADKTTVMGTNRFPPPGMLWEVPSSVLARFCH